MATYIELVRNVRLLSGMQGTGPADVTTAQGVEEVISRFVRDAYADVQNLREEWNFLKNRASFTTTAGKDTYTFLDIFATNTPNFKKYDKHSFIVTQSDGRRKYMKHYDDQVLEARYLNSDAQKLPEEYAIDPSTSSIILKPIPDDVYTVNFQYWERPEILAVNTDIPKLPLTFHNLIVYKALEKLAVYLNAPELYREYSTEASRMSGQVMRLELKKKRMNAGALV